MPISVKDQIGLLRDFKSAKLPDEKHPDRRSRQAAGASTSSPRTRGHADRAVLFRSKRRFHQDRLKPAVRLRSGVPVGGFADRAAHRNAAKQSSAPAPIELSQRSSFDDNFEPAMKLVPVGAQFSLAERSASDHVRGRRVRRA